LLSVFTALSYSLEANTQKARCLAQDDDFPWRVSSAQSSRVRLAVTKGASWPLSRLVTLAAPSPRLTN